LFISSFLIRENWFFLCKHTDLWAFCMYENLFMGTKILIVHHHLCKLQILLNFAQVIDFKKKTVLWSFFKQHLLSYSYTSSKRAPLAQLYSSQSLFWIEILSLNFFYLEFFEVISISDKLVQFPLLQRNFNIECEFGCSFKSVQIISILVWNRLIWK
jgi:hypothetical protein